MLRGIFHFALLAAALADIYRRPVEEIRGVRWLRSEVALVNFVGPGPIDRFVSGRKHA